jgi:hypothetical protein
MSRWSPGHATAFAGTLCALSIILHSSIAGELGQMKVRRGQPSPAPARTLPIFLFRAASV